jgi:hypothetical protein
MVIIYLWEKRTNPSNSWEVETRECIRTHTYVHTLCVWIYTIHATCRRIGSLRAANNNQELFDKKLRNIPISLPAVPASNEKGEERRGPDQAPAGTWHQFDICSRSSSLYSTAHALSSDAQPWNLDIFLLLPSVSVCASPFFRNARRASRQLFSFYSFTVDWPSCVLIGNLTLTPFFFSWCLRIGPRFFVLDTLSRPRFYILVQRVIILTAIA